MVVNVAVDMWSRWAGCWYAKSFSVEVEVVLWFVTIHLQDVKTGGKIIELAKPGLACFTSYKRVNFTKCFKLPFIFKNVTLCKKKDTKLEVTATLFIKLLFIKFV